MSPIKLLILCALVCVSTLNARAQSQGASWVTTGSASASGVSTGVTGILSSGQVVTHLGRMVSRYGARVTSLQESRRSDGRRQFTFTFDVPGMTAARRVSMTVTTNVYGAIEHVSEPRADL